MSTISNLSDLQTDVNADTAAVTTLTTGLTQLETTANQALEDFKAVLGANSATIPAGVLSQLTSNATAFTAVANGLTQINAAIAAADPGPVVPPVTIVPPGTVTPPGVPVTGSTAGSTAPVTTSPASTAQVAAQASQIK